jgi:Protein of unknown function (DUF2911)
MERRTIAPPHWFEEIIAGAKTGFTNLQIPPRNDGPAGPSTRSEGQMKSPRASAVLPENSIDKRLTMLNRIRVSTLTTMLSLALLAAVSVPQLSAGDLDKKTIATFSAPVDISGQTLPAGTYVFKTLTDDRNVVLVMNRDENHLYAMIQAIPIERLVTPDKAEVELSEQAGNAPEVVHAWFYPGENYGWEFPAVKARNAE